MDSRDRLERQQADEPDALPADPEEEVALLLDGLRQVGARLTALEEQVRGRLDELALRIRLAAEMERTADLWKMKLEEAEELARRTGEAAERALALTAEAQQAAERLLQEIPARAAARTEGLLSEIRESVLQSAQDVLTEARSAALSAAAEARNAAAAARTAVEQIEALLRSTPPPGQGPTDHPEILSEIHTTAEALRSEIEQAFAAMKRGYDASISRIERELRERVDRSIAAMHREDRADGPAAHDSGEDALQELRRQLEALKAASLHRTRAVEERQEELAAQVSRLKRWTAAALLAALAAAGVLFFGRAASGEPVQVRPPEGVAIPVRIASNITSIVPVPVPFLPVGISLWTASVEGEILGLPVKGTLKGYTTAAGFFVPIFQRHSIQQTKIDTPAGSITVHAGMVGRDVYIEADPTKGTGAFAGLAARGKLTAEGAMSLRQARFSGEIVTGWTDVREAESAVLKALEENRSLGAQEREALARKVRDALAATALRPFPPSPAPAASRPEQQAAPDDPQVLWDGRADRDVVEGTLTVVVPRGPDRQQVRVVVVGPSSTRTAYEGLHAPADRVVVRISEQAPVVIQVYIDFRLAAAISSGKDSSPQPEQ